MAIPMQYGGACTGRPVAAPTILLNLKLYKEASSADRRARRLGCAAVRDEGALRMRRTPLRVRAVREAADSIDERVCAHLVVPAPAGTCPRPTRKHCAKRFLAEKE